ncbi:MAG: GMP synthase [Gammaproteobacteria bacterium]|nr:GMP synthase [Gammaproteobacteria bacterium]MYF30839.1 GMP synthase [Gammaproteobacteria bacterium]MYK48482.1 GMP synthase [Gammaproteobacteria bacterium]
MRLGILQADHVDPECRGRFGDYADMFTIALGGALDSRTSFEFFDVRRGLYPDRVGACDGYLVTGSRASVYDDEPWIVRLKDFVRELHVARAKTVGICFGHQLIAASLGGVVERADAGWGVGVHTWEVVHDEPWMRPRLVEFRLLASHQDQVETLPEGARLLAASEFCPHAAFSVGSHLFAVQGHPEFTLDYARFLMRRRRNQLGSAFGPAMQSLDTPTDEAVVASWIAGFLLS